MKKKDYQKPTMQVVKLQQQQHLMAGSGVQSVRSSYGKANSEVPVEEVEGETWVWE